MSKDEKLDIDYWYKKYLNLMGLKEHRMPHAQKVETKRAFVGGFGMALVCASDEIASIDNIENAVDELDGLHKQVLTFMEDEI